MSLFHLFQHILFRKHFNCKFKTPCHFIINISISEYKNTQLWVHPWPSCSTALPPHPSPFYVCWKLGPDKAKETVSVLLCNVLSTFFGRSKIKILLLDLPLTFHLVDCAFANKTFFKWYFLTLEFKENHFYPQLNSKRNLVICIGSVEISPLFFTRM